MNYVEKAKMIDEKRAENFMKNHFAYDVKTIKPTLSELFNAMKYLIKKKK